MPTSTFPNGITADVIGNVTGNVTGQTLGSALATGAGTGITTGTGTVATSNITRVGNVITTQIFIDLTGLSSNVAGDIIGVEAAANSHFGAITLAESGLLYAGSMTCVEAPATGEPDLDLYCAVEATGAEDSAISALDETALLTAGADWTLLLSKALTAMPITGEYLYLVGGGGTTDAVYTAGQFIIELYGYAAPA